jgi:hypothetical protein
MAAGAHFPGTTNLSQPYTYEPKAPQAGFQNISGLKPYTVTPEMEAEWARQNAEREALESTYAKPSAQSALEGLAAVGGGAGGGGVVGSGAGTAAAGGGYGIGMGLGSTAGLQDEDEGQGGGAGFQVPGGLRPLGSRIYPPLQSALAGLRKAY